MPRRLSAHTSALPINPAAPVTTIRPPRTWAVTGKKLGATGAGSSPSRREILRRLVAELRFVPGGNQTIGEGVGAGYSCGAVAEFYPDHRRQRQLSVDIPHAR